METDVSPTPHPSLAGPAAMFDGAEQPHTVGWGPTARAVATAIVQSLGNWQRVILLGVASTLTLGVVILLMGERTRWADRAGVSYAFMLIAAAIGVFVAGQQVTKDIGSGILPLLARTPSSRIGIALGYVAGPTIVTTAFVLPQLIFFVIARGLSDVPPALTIIGLLPLITGALLAYAGTACVAAFGKGYTALFIIGSLIFGASSAAWRMVNPGLVFFSPVWTGSVVLFDRQKDATAAVAAALGSLPVIWWFIRALADRIHRPDLPGVGVAHTLRLILWLAAAAWIGLLLEATLAPNDGNFRRNTDWRAIFLGSNAALAFGLSWITVPRIALRLTATTTPGITGRLRNLLPIAALGLIVTAMSMAPSIYARSARQAGLPSLSHELLHALWLGAMVAVLTTVCVAWATSFRRRRLPGFLWWFIMVALCILPAGINVFLAGFFDDPSLPILLLSPMALLAALGTAFGTIGPDVAGLQNWLPIASLAWAAVAAYGIMTILRVGPAAPLPDWGVGADTAAATNPLTPPPLPLAETQLL